MCSSKILKIFKIDTKKNITDIMTKLLECQTHRKLRNKISCISSENEVENLEKT